MPRISSRAAPLAACLTLCTSSCANLSPAAAVRDVESLVRERLALPYSAATSTAAVARIDGLLSQPLTAATAVELALLSNRDLQASFEHLGIAQAELARAKAPPNPEIGAHVRIPTADNEAGLNVEASITVNLIELLRNIPESRAAEAELDRTKLELADEILRTATETRINFYTLQAAEQLVHLERSLAEAGEAARLLSERQLEAGTETELAAAEQTADYQLARIELRRAELEARSARELLHQTFGLQTPPDRWTIDPTLPALPDKEIDLENLTELAQKKRLDLAALETEIDLANRRIRLAHWNRFPELRAGVSLEREHSGQTAVGPEVAVQLPIFDWNRGEIAREEAALREAEKRFAARTQQVESELRIKREQVIAARELAAYYRDAVIPLRKRAVQLAQQHYNIMTLGVFDLLRIKRSEFEAEKHHLEALRDYWIARAELERAAGTYLIEDRQPARSSLGEPPRTPASGPATQPATQPAGQPASQPAPHHHHHRQGE